MPQWEEKNDDVNAKRKYYLSITIRHEYEYVGSSSILAGIRPTDGGTQTSEWISIADAIRLQSQHTSTGL